MRLGAQKTHVVVARHLGSNNYNSPVSTIFLMEPVIVMQTLLSTNDYLGWQALSPKEPLFYGSNEKQFGHLYIPSTNKKHRVVVVIHGGCWLDAYDLEPLGPLCQSLCEAGYAVWSLEYRRLGGGGGWPTTFLDVGEGVDHLRSLSEEYSLDLSCVVVSGHSAGGHLAMWTAARHKLKEGDELFVSNPLRVAGVIPLAGIPDLQTAKDWDICQTCPMDLMGGSYDEFPERYRQGSPKHLAPLSVPQIFIIGHQDPIVPLPYVQSYINYAQQLGEDISIWSFERSGHFEVVHPGSEAGSSVVRAVTELLLKPTQSK